LNEPTRFKSTVERAECVIFERLFRSQRITVSFVEIVRQIKAKAFVSSVWNLAAEHSHDAHFLLWFRDVV